MWNISRRWLQTLLGIIWFIDGILQVKPQMFSSQFINQVLLPAAQGQPFWIDHTISWAANVVAPHIFIYNIIFAAIQLFLGVMLIINRWVKGTLVISFIWTVLVWWFSEGFGMLFTGQATFLTGAPGAVFLYGLIGIIIWPKNEEAKIKRRLHQKWSRVAQYSLAVLWIVGGLLQLQPVFLTQGGMNGIFSFDAFNYLAAIHPVFLTLTFAVLMWVAGILLLFKNHPTIVVIGFWLSVVLALFIWWAGEGFGQLLSPLGTDPNSGPLFILLALCIGTPYLVYEKSPKNMLQELSHQTM